MIAIQYLENTPQLAGIKPQHAADRLAAAFERLPIQRLILGWALPVDLVSACAEVCHQQEAELFYWQPLLSGDGVLQPTAHWRATGLCGEAVPGFQNLPEFTFMCPNRPGVQQAVLARLERLLADGFYDGLFLDRMRYPSPVEDPSRWLACFCPHCQAAAAAQGLELVQVRQELESLLSTAQGALRALTALLNPSAPVLPQTTLLRSFQAFRQASISSMLTAAIQQIQASGCQAGLDAFAPTLTGLVAQNLSVLGPQADWVKIMVYGHTLGPAGLPFELLALCDWLVARYGLTEELAIAELAQITQISLPVRRANLSNPGLTSEAIAAEVQRASSWQCRSLLAGIELVNLPGITHLQASQVRADLRALRQSGADGLVLSWDLWQMPLEYLDLVRQEWF